MEIPEILITLTKVEIQYDQSVKQDVWFVERFEGLDIYDVSNGRNYEKELLIAKEQSKNYDCPLKINR